ncbi:hypothetical protein LH128_04796 [Sphingomonas sp. LH128]|uniref:hypothetical protein n=1 Tax=Sphingomonas sp. LH128 TaxID=473781 RepID=UPI00027CC947|nr:hypothetical protein [Sphingomonas sp. LH128]EJU14236.1 hypothetical protein LH128_04796 [Sphingomonas sp. LH128]
MKSFDTLTAMASHLPAEACAQMRTILADFPDHWDHPDIEHVSFTQLIDSPVFLVEAADDLAQVRSLDEDEGQRLSLLQAASGWFDIAEWRCGGAFAVFCAIDSANGGAKFYVPRQIADAVPNVAESIRLKSELDDSNFPFGGRA